MRSQFISLIIGLTITLTVSFLSYQFIQRQNSQDHHKEDSKFFESLEVLQNRIDDLKLTGRKEQNPVSPVVIVAVDDASINEIGRWPWSRSTLTELSEQILSSGAKTLTYDLILSEPERENLKADENLGQLIEKYSDRFILGTASSDQYPAQTKAYQDICTAEAFLYLGGDKIVTLNPTFIVDDQSENYDTYKWNILFHEIFKSLSDEVEKQYLNNLKAFNFDQLTLYQKNALVSKKNKVIYNYCYTWLTDDDLYLRKEIIANTLSLYEKVFEQKLNSEQFTILTNKIKSVMASPIPQYLGWYSNTPAIQNKSQYTASFNAKMDSDGVIRKYPLFFRAGAKIGSSYIPSLAMQTYLIAKNYRAEVILRENTNKSEKQIHLFQIFNQENDKTALLEIPIDTFSQIRLNFYGPEKSFYYVSAKELLTTKENSIEVSIRGNQKIISEKVDKNIFFKDKSVFIGATALGIYDVRNTPVQNAMPGTEIHMTALANLMEANFMTQLKNSEFYIPSITFVLGLFFTLTWSWSSALTSLSIFLVSSVFLSLIDYFIFIKKSIMITNWPFLVVYIVCFGAISLYKYFAEEKNKYKVRKAFSKYVSPAIVEELLKSEKNMELGGQKKNLTVLFSDLRGFTTFSEKLDPKQLSDFLNLYLTKMTEEIFKTKGTVDKFIGDAIMAFYGAPVPFTNHAEQACLCALESIKKLEQFNQELKGRDFPHLEMGIGINTGDMSVGNMGSATIQNYTVMGDSVNLASRLEGLTRLYGNFIILGPQTYEMVKEKFTCREIDQVIVKGKTTSILIYDLLYQGPVQANDQVWLQHYNLGRQNYTLGAFNEALESFKLCLELKKTDNISNYFFKKCEFYIKNPPTGNWNGINYMREK